MNYFAILNIKFCLHLKIILSSDAIYMGYWHFVLIILSAVWAHSHFAVQLQLSYHETLQSEQLMMLP